MKNNLKKIIISAIIALGITAGIYSALASTIPIAPAVFETSLNTPISTSSTSMTLTSGTLANGSTLSGYACFTVDSGNPNVEFICGTASGTSITSLIRGIDTLDGKTSVASLIFAHRRGADVKITDFPVFSVIRNIANGTDTFPNAISYGAGINPVANQDLATKHYVDITAGGASITTNALIESGTAGETVSVGQVLYLKAADGRWWKANASTASTVDTIQLGIAQGAGTAGNPITGGVLRRGVDTNQSGGSAGALGYVVNGGGTVGTAAGTTERVIGNFLSTTTFNFNPAYYYTLTANQKGAMGTISVAPSSANKFLTQNELTTLASTANIQTFTSSGTWTKPSGAKMVRVIAIGAGGGGASGSMLNASSQNSGGGGGGAVTIGIFDASTLSATETVTVGTGGTGGTANVSTSHNGISGTDGTASSFGTWLNAGGGGGGISSGSALGGGGGGSLSSAALSVAGVPGASAANDAIGGQGASGATAAKNAEWGGASSGAGTAGGSSIFGAGAGGGVTGGGVGSNGGISGAYSIGGGAAGGASGDPGLNGTNGSDNSVLKKGYGAGGGGGGGSNTAGTGSSKVAGNGGNGGIPGGGGGGGGTVQTNTVNGTSGTGGNGGRGQVVVITLF